MVYQDPVVSPYSQEVQNIDGETLPLSEIMKIAVQAGMIGLKVSMPAMITQVNGNQSVNVQPLLQTRTINGIVQTLPPIQNVMVSMPKGADYSIKLPIAVGDTGHILVSDRSLDAWSAGSGGIVDPQDSRIHDLNDAIFVPGICPFSEQTTDATSDMVLTNGIAVVRLMKSGKFTVSNGTNELLNLIDEAFGQLEELSSTLSTDTVNTMLGPMKLNAFSTYQTIAEAVGNLKTLLETLKG